MVKKLSVLLALVVCATFVYQASAGVVPGSPSRLFWRDDFGDAFDAYVEAAPGDTIFVQVEVNNNQWSAVRNTQMNMWWDTNVLDDPTAEYLPYAHLKDYRSGGGYIPGGLPWLGAWTLDFGGSNVYIYTGGPGTSIPGTVPLNYPWGVDAGGMLLGFYIPISASAPMGETTFNIQVRGMSAWGSSWVWVEELSTAVNPEWAMTINVIPEPATMSLLAIGGVLALIRRKK